MTALSSSIPTPLPTRPVSPTTLDPRSITSPDQIAAQLALLSKREADLTLALNTLISDRSAIDGTISQLQRLGLRVRDLSVEVDGPSEARGLGLENATSNGYGDDESGLVERVRRVWETSERVGGKVRRLDEEVGRVREATDVVTEVLELKNALQTLASAMSQQDWESASRACKRAMDIRSEVINGGYAGAVVPTPQQPLPPAQFLEESRATLLQTFRSEFDAAAVRKDEQGVSRYFRLWPGIGAEKEGLEAYGDFVVGLVKARSSNPGKASNPLYYLTSLTSLLESIAHIIDQHQPVVDKYYGQGHMRTVVGRLVAESDRVIRNLVEGWEEERRVGRLISETKQSRFSLLQSPQLCPPLFASLHTSTNQLSLSSLATTNLTSASNLLQSYAPGAKKPAPSGGSGTPVGLDDEHSGPDPRDVDKVLGELVALGGRWALFKRFVNGRIVVDSDVGIEEDSAKDAAASSEKPETVNQSSEMAVIEQSGSQQAIENLLRVYYEPLEVWYLRSSIEKAHRLETPEASARPCVSSVLDDTFYLLKVVLNRLLSCGSLSTLHSMRDKIATVIEHDYAYIIRHKMEAVYAGAASSIQERGAEKDKRDKDQRLAFVIYLNDFDVSADYTERLLEETLHSLPQVFLDSEIALVKEELGLLGSLSNRFKSLCRTGLEQLFNQLTRPRLRGILDDCYRDVSYHLDEDAFAAAEEDQFVRKRFTRAWEGLMDGYKDSFTDNNYQAFFNMTVEILVRPWEKMILSMRFTELGGIRFERDVRAIINYLSSQTNFGGAREKFVRLQQIATVLNMDAEEDPEEFYSNSGISWRLSKSEYIGVVEQRKA
ncbi:COG4 transport protein-domain-containing protein [Kockovaella imperatae]|uniref:Conserved oligomeric Golgi complex subunit 4 n=1 Tax=Kockovaella imperatae TaxID=4999 RepID=A0A1Y1UF00_9TREE|nr:COG4 transport protein-domain-containing protein [Kockovaella imperatae]ORX36086.1 COG4 transport protein-domain-containing protein [Kockovaella imperatae]